jgi:nucleotide-binding universal stress UspA family protein
MRSPSAILVPIDGSSCARRALEYASKRASSADGAPLLILNAQPAIASSRLVSRAMINEHHERNSDEALKSALAFLKRRKLKAEIITKIGDPAETIIAIAKSKGCGEIVMGNNGRGRIAGLLLGSVAAKVIQLAPCPVTLVK